MNRTYLLLFLVSADLSFLQSPSAQRVQHLSASLTVDAISVADFGISTSTSLVILGMRPWHQLI
jgi:hypothetical protein